jgi:hypothetical protein
MIASALMAICTNYAASIWAAAENFEFNIDDAAMIAEGGPLGLQKFFRKYGAIS